MENWGRRRRSSSARCMFCKFLINYTLLRFLCDAGGVGMCFYISVNSFSAPALRWGVLHTPSDHAAAAPATTLDEEDGSILLPLLMAEDLLLPRCLLPNTPPVAADAGRLGVRRRRAGSRSLGSASGEEVNYFPV